MISPDLTIVIPFFNENSAIPVITSLFEADRTDLNVLVIAVVNAPVNADDSIKLRNKKLFNELNTWASNQQSSNWLVQVQLHNDLPTKKAGVGLARKLGMDAAAKLLSDNGNQGVIVCLDADCTVASNYLQAIHRYFKINPKIAACSIYFEHPLSGLESHLNSAIVQYELHLRYFRQTLEWTGHAFPYHTVGSSMAVRSNIYLQSRGMNTRKAGEDFYFLQKLFTQYPFGTLNETTVYPEARISERVPFGTGMSLKKFCDGGMKDYLTYNPYSFKRIRSFIHSVQHVIRNNLNQDFTELGREDEVLSEFLVGTNFYKDMETYFTSKNDKELIVNAFNRWFNNFRVIRLLHHYRDNGLSDVPVTEAANWLHKGESESKALEAVTLLDIFRKNDKLAD